MDRNVHGLRTTLLMVLLLAVSIPAASEASASVEKDAQDYDCDGEGDLSAAVVDDRMREDANVKSPSQPFNKKALARR
jgi:hypothetical protein